MKYTLPALPYAYDALEPILSKEIMILHHQKHHQAYVNNLNAALEKYEKAATEEDLSAMISLQPLIQFNGGGHINHEFFWNSLAPMKNGGGELPNGELLKSINKEWGSLNLFIENFNSIAAPIQGSGWCWLGFCKRRKQLVIESCQNHELLITKNIIPLLCIDVWEHAYYLQYKNVRTDYLKSIWSVVNWQNVNNLYCKTRELCLTCSK